MHVVIRQLRVWQSFPVYKVMYVYEGQYRGLGFYTSRIFEHGKRRRVGICDDSSEPSLLPYNKVWMSRREDPRGIFNMLFIETAI